MKKSSSPSPSRSPRLDQIDGQLVSLLTERARLVAEFAAPAGPGDVAAAQRLMRQFVAQREIESSLDRTMVEEVMRDVVSRCYAAILPDQIAYLGPPYSYTHLAAVEYFGDSSRLTSVGTIGAVFQSLTRGDCAAGVVPIQNSTDGRVVDTLGMFLQHQVRICGELLLPIEHCLLSRTPRSEIVEVYSKPQALSQCRQWLAQNLPAAKLVEMNSTAAAAQLAADQHGAAAVASRQAGAQYGLDVLAASIQDIQNNVTRFAILGSGPSDQTGDDKTAILFQVDHKPGALADSMTLFKSAGLNLTWIESFPLPGSRDEYLFFIEFEGHQAQPIVAETIALLSKASKRFEVLGSYPRHRLITHNPRPQHE
jgi:chorismate mutase/prephenate dehydratase